MYSTLPSRCTHKEDAASVTTASSAGERYGRGRGPRSQAVIANASISRLRILLIIGECHSAPIPDRKAHAADWLRVEIIKSMRKQSAVLDLGHSIAVTSVPAQVAVPRLVSVLHVSSLESSYYLLRMRRKLSIQLLSPRDKRCRPLFALRLPC